jgi:hypothetical protein
LLLYTLGGPAVLVVVSIAVGLLWPSSFRAKLKFLPVAAFCGALLWFIAEQPGYGQNRLLYNGLNLLIAAVLIMATLWFVKNARRK